MHLKEERVWPPRIHLHQLFMIVLGINVHYLKYHVHGCHTMGSCGIRP